MESDRIMTISLSTYKTHILKNLKLYKKSKEGKTITTFYTFCVKLSDEREKKRKERTRPIKKYSRWLSECLKRFPFERF